MIQKTFVAEEGKDKKKARLSWYHPDDTVSPFPSSCAAPAPACVLLSKVRSAGVFCNSPRLRNLLIAALIFLVNE